MNDNEQTFTPSAGASGGYYPPDFRTDAQRAADRRRAAAREASEVAKRFEQYSAMTLDEAAQCVADYLEVDDHYGEARYTYERAAFALDLLRDAAKAAR